MKNIEYYDEERDMDVFEKFEILGLASFLVDSNVSPALKQSEPTRPFNYCLG